MLIRRVAQATAAFFALLPAFAHAAPVVLSAPVAAPLEGDGTGLCAATAESTSANDVLPLLNASGFDASLNGFMEDHASDRIELVLQTIFDLSNNNELSARRPSYGDFTSVTPANCGVGGCSFVTSDAATEAHFNAPETAYASRFRGFLNVTTAFAAKPVHFGFYADDGVSLTFYDQTAGATPVLTRYLQVGRPTWRTTNTVTFQNPGLYPFEILYFEVAEHAALEMSYFIGDFTDFESVPGSADSPSLKDANFTLFPPTAFFQTLSGVPSFPDLAQCQQCERRFAGSNNGNNGCTAGNYCNEAALCAPCDTAFFCGPACSSCDGDKQFCVDVNGQKECGQCRTSLDCQEGFSCDEATHTCQECNVDSDCPRANICVDHSCVPCTTADRCAGNSCNCCPLGSNGVQMGCTPVDQGGPSVCVECVENADCPSGICDVPAGHCVDELRKYKSDCCGEDCVKCPSDYPHCIPGPVGTACAECRHDMDCSDGNYCLSGECKACVKDRRCGPRCDSCGGDKPFCLGTQFADDAICVRCTSDEQCGDGSECNRETHDCVPACMATCGPDTPYCDGQVCVECYADTQCPCGNTCDLSTNTCDTSCKGNVDCLGNEHCRYTESAEAKECALGPMPEDVACGGTLASACGANIGRRGDEPPPAGLLALVMLALFGRRRTGALR